MKPTKKLYKVIDANFKSKDGGNFNWKPYLPKGNKAGKWTPKIKDCKICKRGYHLTDDYNKYLNNAKHVFLAEGINLSDKQEDKVVCESVRLLKEIETNTGKENTGLANSGEQNSGDQNSGNSNSGNRNSGNQNSGNRNSGDQNSGDQNSGDQNSGDRNSGNWNSGNQNSGNWNSGNRNSGNRNSGNRNSGDQNSGDQNSGDQNSGNWNSGNWNSGNQNSGYFNTDTPKIRIFNKETNKTCDFPDWLYFNLNTWTEVKNMTDEEKVKFWWYKTTDGYLRTTSYKEAFKIAFDKATKEDIKATLRLPNFSYELFEQISGINKEMIQDKLKGNQK